MVHKYNPNWILDIITIINGNIGVDISKYNQPLSYTLRQRLLRRIEGFRGEVQLVDSRCIDIEDFRQLIRSDGCTPDDVGGFLNLRLSTSRILRDVIDSIGIPALVSNRQFIDSLNIEEPEYPTDNDGVYDVAPIIGHLTDPECRKPLPKYHVLVYALTLYAKNTRWMYQSSQFNLSVFLDLDLNDDSMDGLLSLIKHIPKINPMSAGQLKGYCAILERINRYALENETIMREAITHTQFPFEVQPIATIKVK